MSISVVAMVLKRRLGSTARKAVAFKLADVADDDGGNIFPSVKTIAAEAEVSERTAQYILGEFVKEGLLVVVEKRSNGGCGSDKTTKYRFDLNVLMAFPSTKDTSVINRGAESAPPLRTVLSTGVQTEQLGGANPASSGCSPCTQSFIREPSKRSQVLRAGARRHEPRSDSNFGNGTKDALTRRAEGLGLDVDDLIATVNDRAPKKRAAYFTRLCLTQLMPRLPGIPEDFIRDALWGKNPKGYDAIMQTLNLAEAP